MARSQMASQRFGGTATALRNWRGQRPSRSPLSILLSLVLLVSAAALCCSVAGAAVDFVAPTRGRPSRQLRGQTRLYAEDPKIATPTKTRDGDPQSTRNGVEDRPMTEEEELEYDLALMEADWAMAVDQAMYPPELMWNEDDPEVLKEVYPGARDFWSIFWSIILPTTSAGFLIVGLSAYFEYDLVDLTPWTSQALGFLRANQFIRWIPQGAFMTFYGFFGTFVISPFLWWLIWDNKGQGVSRFDRRIQKYQMIRDGVLKKDIRFEDIDTIQFTWTNLALFGPREVWMMLKNGDEVHFQENTVEIPKRVLERKAARLADFLEKELIVDDQ